MSFGGLSQSIKKKGQFAPLSKTTAARRLPTNMNNNPTYRTPHASRATRNVISPSKASLRGLLVAQLPGFPWPRQIHYESMLEYRFLCLTLVRDDIHAIWDQPPAITFRRPDGNRAQHVFDFLVTLKCGKRVAVAIKPEERVFRSGFVAELEAVAAATKKPFADKILLVTEKQLDRRAAVEAARQLMHARPQLTEAVA